jgi:hypothetical protein
MQDRKLFKSIRFIIIFALIMLCYVHQQVEIVKTSYAIDKNSKELSYLLDRHRALVYNLNKLEKPSALEAKLCIDKTELTIPDRKDIVGTPADECGSGTRTGKRNILARILDLFSTKAEAQVK